MTSFLRNVKNYNRKPPDHWFGYFVAVSGLLMQMMTYGIDNSFSIFSSSMQNDPTLGYPSATAVSFGNSVSLGLSPVFGVFTGFIADYVPPRYLMLASTVLLFAGLWLCSSFAHSTIAVTFSYCLLASISSALMLAPGAAATGSWFRKRLGLAEGINFAGGGVGSAFIPAILGHWADMYGWRKTFRLMSAFCAIGLVGAIFSCRRQMEEGERYAAPGQDSSAAHDDNGETGDGNHNGHLDGGAERREPHGDALYDDVAAMDVVSPTEQKRQQQQKQMDKADAAVADNNNNSSSSNDGNEVPMLPPTAHEELMEALHTRRLNFFEILRVCITIEFLANFFAFLIYGWAFYGLIYVAVPLVSSMGKAGTVYEHEIPISTGKASTVFTFWGVFQIIGSIAVGAMASFTADAFAYCCCACLGGFATAALVFCRSYAAFCACLSIVGFCTAGIFAIMPALIARFLYGPNLGLFMGCVFVAGCVGGFSAPPMQAQLQTRNNGNYTYGCLVISCCMTAPGMICYLFLWPNKRNTLSRALHARRERALAEKKAAAMMIADHEQAYASV